MTSRELHNLIHRPTAPSPHRPPAPPPPRPTAPPPHRAPHHTPPPPHVNLGVYRADGEGQLVVCRGALHDYRDVATEGPYAQHSLVSLRMHSRADSQNHIFKFMHTKSSPPPLQLYDQRKTRRIPLFEGGGMVPPALDLVHANVYCFSDDDKQRLLANLSRCPGGLFMVQDNMSALWPHLFGPEYDNLRSLRTAAASGDTEAVAAMIARGVSMDLPFPDNNNEVSPLAAAVIEFMHDNIGRETIDQLLAAGANPLTALDNRKFGDIFEAKRAELGILGNVAAAVLDSLTSAAGRASLTIRTSLNSLRGSLSLSNSSAASDDSATLAAAAASATVQDGRSMRSKRMARLSFSERGSKGGSAKFATFSLIPPAYRKLFALMDQVSQGLGSDV